MSIETIQLTGDAIGGIAPTLDHLRAFVDAGLPVEVRLGRIRNVASPKSVPRLESYVDLALATPFPEVDWYTKAADALGRMYLNDRLGCCVVSGKAHALAIWSANDPDSGGQVFATDAEIESQYVSVCGPGDNGCSITAVLDYMKKSGFQASGKRYTIDGYVSCDWTSKELVQTGLQLFGAASIGINLPQAWTSQAIWDVTNTSIVGGHDVTPCGHGKPHYVTGVTTEGVIISSWGRLYLITWPAFTSKKWIEEMYFMVPTFLWTGLDKMAPSGVDLTTLKADMVKIGQGQIPSVDPGPVVPPPPPVPGTPLYTLTFKSSVSKGKTISYLSPTAVPKGSKLIVYPPEAEPMLIASSMFEELS